MYENGKGVKKNLEKAYEYYLSAARGSDERRGNLDSQKKVAEMYKEGIGTEKNIEKSEYWLKQIEESKVISQ
jgi:TPR repeat protein